MKKPAKRNTKKHKWLPDEIAQLGKVSDRELARRTGARAAEVSRKRASMGIDPLSKSKLINWTQENLALLGLATDREVAEIMNCSGARVTAKRLSLGIECYSTASKSWHTWTEEEIALLGTESDVAIARKIGINVRTVSHKRQHLGIPCYSVLPPSERRKRTKLEWTAKEIGMLGKMSDKEIAASLERTVYTVRKKRYSLNIPVFPRSKNGKTIWTPEVMERLFTGKASDLSKELGVSRQRIHQKRKEEIERKEEQSAQTPE